MPDRRQGDRRDSSSFKNKKVSISFGTIIFVIIILVILIASAFLCNHFHSTGYDQGYVEGYDQGYTDGINDAHLFNQNVNDTTKVE